MPKSSLVKTIDNHIYYYLPSTTGRFKIGDTTIDIDYDMSKESCCIVLDVENKKKKDTIRKAISREVQRGNNLGRMKFSSDLGSYITIVKVDKSMFESSRKKRQVKAMINKKKRQSRKNETIKKKKQRLLYHMKMVDTLQKELEHLGVSSMGQNDENIELLNADQKEEVEMLMFTNSTSNPDNQSSMDNIENVIESPNEDSDSESDDEYEDDDERMYYEEIRPQVNQKKLERLSYFCKRFVEPFHKDHNNDEEDLSSLFMELQDEVARMRGKPNYHRGYSTLPDQIEDNRLLRDLVFKDYDDLYKKLERNNDIEKDNWFY